MSQGTAGGQATPAHIHPTHPSQSKTKQKMHTTLAHYPAVILASFTLSLDIIHLENEQIPQKLEEAAPCFHARVPFQPRTSTELDLAPANESILKSVCTNNTDHCITCTHTHTHAHAAPAKVDNGVYTNAPKRLINDICGSALVFGLNLAALTDRCKVEYEPTQTLGLHM